MIGFHGESVAELRAAFEDAVDDYLETCKKAGGTAPTPRMTAKIASLRGR
ncbi:MAG: hypothetical protein Q8J75_06140 [Rhodocyclaceae bacterium]|nr:hypothetical protein [Rhodocyclaceae bacterium]